jgi:phage terminase large subunit-like protein
MVTRAVWYLARTQAGPVLRDESQWFEHMLQVLLELAFPNTHLDDMSLAFLQDIEEGLSKFKPNGPSPPCKGPFGDP